MPTDVYTTGTAAKIVGCAPTTITRAIDAGVIPCWRVGHDRRISRESLAEYMKANGIPLERLSTVDVSRKKTTRNAIKGECDADDGAKGEPRGRD